MLSATYRVLILACLARYALGSSRPTYSLESQDLKNCTPTRHDLEGIVVEAPPTPESASSSSTIRELNAPPHDAPTRGSAIYGNAIESPPRRNPRPQKPTTRFDALASQLEVPTPEDKRCGICDFVFGEEGLCSQFGRDACKAIGRTSEHATVKQDENGEERLECNVCEADWRTCTLLADNPCAGRCSAKYTDCPRPHPPRDLTGPSIDANRDRNKNIQDPKNPEKCECGRAWQKCNVLKCEFCVTIQRYDCLCDDGPDYNEPPEPEPWCELDTRPKLAGFIVCIGGVMYLGFQIFL